MSAEVVEGRSVVPRPVASATPRTFPAVPRLPPVALAGGDLPSEAHSRRAAWEGVPPRRARETHKQHGGSGGRSSPDSQEEAEMADRWQDDYEREPGRGRAASKPRKSGVAVRRRGVEKGRKGGRNGEPHERVTSQAALAGDSRHLRPTSIARMFLDQSGLARATLTVSTRMTMALAVMSRSRALGRCTDRGESARARLRS
jgi:hypothetical protein